MRVDAKSERDLFCSALHRLEDAMNTADRRDRVTSSRVETRLAEQTGHRLAPTQCFYFLSM